MKTARRRSEVLRGRNGGGAQTEWRRRRSGGGAQAERRLNGGSRLPSSPTLCVGRYSTGFVRCSELMQGRTPSSGAAPGLQSGRISLSLIVIRPGWILPFEAWVHRRSASNCAIYFSSFMGRAVPPQGSPAGGQGRLHSTPLRSTPRHSTPHSTIHSPLSTLHTHSTRNKGNGYSWGLSISRLSHQQVFITMGVSMFGDSKVFPPHRTKHEGFCFSHHRNEIMGLKP